MRSVSKTGLTASAFPFPYSGLFDPFVFFPVLLWLAKFLLSANYIMNFGLWALCPPQFELQLGTKRSPNFSPLRPNLFLRAHSTAFSTVPFSGCSSPSLSKKYIYIYIKNSSNGSTAYSFACSSISRCFSARLCHRIPIFLRSSF